MSTTTPIKSDWQSARRSLARKIESLRSNVALVGAGKAKSLLILGYGGLGKTHHVMDTLARQGFRNPRAGIDAWWHHDVKKEPRYEWALFKGQISPKGTYRALFENRNRLVIFDDADSTLDNKTSANVLKGALDSYDERIVTWQSEARSDLPRSFAFQGRCIFISNKPLAAFPQAFLSRSNFVEFKLTATEKRVLISDYAGTRDREVSPAVKEEVLAHVFELAYKLPELSIRTYQRFLQYRLAYPSNWKSITSSTL